MLNFVYLLFTTYDLHVHPYTLYILSAAHDFFLWILLNIFPLVPDFSDTVYFNNLVTPIIRSESEHTSFYNTLCDQRCINKVWNFSCCDWCHGHLTYNIVVNFPRSFWPTNIPPRAHRLIQEVFLIPKKISLSQKETGQKCEGA